MARRVSGIAAVELLLITPVFAILFFGLMTLALASRLINLRETVGIVSEMRVEDRLRRRLHQIAEQIGTRDLNLDNDHLSLGVKPHQISTPIVAQRHFGLHHDLVAQE